MTSTLPSPPPVLRLAEPGDLVAAVPVLIGFRPRESLVLVALGGRSGRRIGLTLRVDLPPPHDAEAVAAVAEEAVACLEADDPDGAAVVVVGASGRARAATAEAVVDALERRGVAVRAVLGAERVEGGAEWACLGACGCRGVLPDPDATPSAAAAVAGGQVVRRDREDLERLVAPADPGRLRRREQQLLAAVDAALRAPDPGVDHDAAHLAVVTAAVADAAAGRLELDDDRVLALAAALVRPTVRDAALLHSGRGGPDTAAAAETLYAALCRELPDPEAAEAAASLAALALLRGDGALANVALDRADASWPGHRLAALLRATAQRRISPAQVRQCLFGETPTARGEEGR